jgi:hypothetical protein
MNVQQAIEAPKMADAGVSLAAPLSPTPCIRASLSCGNRCVPEASPKELLARGVSERERFHGPMGRTGPGGTIRDWSAETPE